MSIVAAIQMNSGDDVSVNLERASCLIAQASRLKARVAVLPECFALMPSSSAQRIELSEPEGGGVVEEALSALAAEHGIWIISAGIFTAAGDRGLVRNTGFVHDASGERVARYDKIHLFDAKLGDGENYRESAYIEAGEALEVVDTPAGTAGISICYDVRFPEMYRELASRGASWFVVPSAFAHTTGSAHWDVLLRARAIENFAYVVAPAQFGAHPAGRRTHGHTMIVDPWGQVMARKEEGEGVIVAEISESESMRLRESFSISR